LVYAGDKRVGPPDMLDESGLPVWKGMVHIVTGWKGTSLNRQWGEQEEVWNNVFNSGYSGDVHPLSMHEPFVSIIRAAKDAVFQMPNQPNEIKQMIWEQTGYADMDPSTFRERNEKRLQERKKIKEPRIVNGKEDFRAKYNEVVSEFNSLDERFSIHLDKVLQEIESLTFRGPVAVYY
jgi:hypothetical protein